MRRLIWESTWSTCYQESVAIRFICFLSFCVFELLGHPVRFVLFYALVSQSCRLRIYVELARISCITQRCGSASALQFVKSSWCHIYTWNHIPKWSGTVTRSRSHDWAAICGGDKNGSALQLHTLQEVCEAWREGKWQGYCCDCWKRRLLRSY